MACQSKQKKPSFLQSYEEQVEEALQNLLEQLKQLREDGARLEEEEFVRRQLLTFCPEMDIRIDVCHVS
jgi:hypothetical protein